MRGACQSYFEAIMEAGADFASSPGRILIDFIDPIIVAEKVATIDEHRFVSMREILREIKEGRQKHRRQRRKRQTKSQ